MNYHFFTHAMSS